jgi:hypothetical protein
MRRAPSPVTPPPGVRGDVVATPPGVRPRSDVVRAFGTDAEATAGRTSASATSACAICATPCDGTLCITCAAALRCAQPCTPEQVTSAATRPAGAGLIDEWGRVHLLEAITTVGRRSTLTGLQLMHASVSRSHAELRREPLGWTLHDLDSLNGCRVNDQPVHGALRLRWRDVVCFGEVKFYLVPADAVGAVAVDVDVETSPMVLAIGASTDHVDDDPPATAPHATGAPMVAAERRVVLADERRGQQIHIIEAPSGGGGYLYLRQAYVQITQLQLAFLRMLIARRQLDRHQPPEHRGFVDTKALLVGLPWECRQPTENHVKQLVRRMRDLLADAGVDDMLESRRGVGYRLCWEVRAAGRPATARDA